MGDVTLICVSVYERRDCFDFGGFFNVDRPLAFSTINRLTNG